MPIDQVYNKVSSEGMVKKKWRGSSCSRPDCARALNDDKESVGLKGSWREEDVALRHVITSINGEQHFLHLEFRLEQMLKGPAFS